MADHMTWVYAYTAVAAAMFAYARIRFGRWSDRGDGMFDVCAAVLWPLTLAVMLWAAALEALAWLLGGESGVSRTEGEKS